MRALTRTLIALLALLLSANALRAQQAFYQATPSEIAGAPGAIIRQEPMVFPAPVGAKAYRVLYRSTGLNGETIPVSGVIVVPLSPLSAADRPIIAWAHPTTGVVPRCAPSLALFVFQQIQGLRQMIDRGIIVAATDYPGLGTPQTHPYLVGVSEARAVLDSVRAAREITGASNRFAVWGHSQGGQAALFTGILATRYAPELALLGVAAAAPATDLAKLLGEDINTAGGRNLTSMTLWSWLRIFNAPIDHVVDPAAMPVVDRLATECIESVYDLMQRRQTSAPLEQKFLSIADFYTAEPWRARMADNSPGTLPASLPLFLAQGGADELVRPQVTAAYMQRQCQAGGKVRMLILPSSNHGLIAKDAAAAVDWIADRFAGAPAPSDCGGN